MEWDFLSGGTNLSDTGLNLSGSWQQHVDLLGLAVVLTGISLKTELRFKSYSRLKFGPYSEVLTGLGDPLGSPRVAPFF